MEARLNIIVCIKQVIAGDQVRVDPLTHRLVRSMESSRINPFDLYPLAMAVHLKKEYSASITALTMGPEISQEVLWEALAIGADRAVLLSDSRFAGSDTLATSYVLGMAVRKIGNYDLILSGVRTTDSGTSQVGPQLAEELNIPHLAGVERIARHQSRFHVDRLSDGFREKVEVTPPALLTVSAGTGMRTPSLIEIEDTFIRTFVEKWNLEDLKADASRVGHDGSRTWVEDFIPIAKQKSCRFIEGDPRQQAKSLLAILTEKNLLS